MICSDADKRTFIQDVLESVHFFRGDYFDENDKESVIEEQLAKNKLLQINMSQVLEHFRDSNLIRPVMPELQENKFYGGW